MRITPFSGAPILNAVVHRLCALHAPVAQFCFKSFALRSFQCGRKTRYLLDFWSLDLPSARVHFYGPSPSTNSEVAVSLTAKVHY